VYAALQPADARFDDANVVVIEGREALLVVDAPADAAFARRVCAEIRKLSSLEVRYVVNTHWHADHTQGNAVYRQELGPSIEFVGHESLLRDVPERAERDLRERVARLEARIPEAERQLAVGRDDDGTEIPESERAKQRAAIDRTRSWLERNRDAEFVVPTRVYSEKSLTLSLGGRDVILLHARAHTRGDTVVHVPDAGVLITGDVLDDLPFVGHGYPREWIAVLRDLEALGAETVIPGHGPVFHGPEQLRNVRGYLEDLVAQVGRAAVSGITLDEARAGVDLSAWRLTLAGEDAPAQRFFDGTVDAAIERAWAEAQGTAD
jgi:glyoxylase-like metal-dependent hydrolase (beta-lactamase superfamily II)